MSTDITIPASCPFGEGAPFQIDVRRDIKTRVGNVILPAGRYTAWQEDLTLPEAKLGTVVVFTEGRHYAGCEWASIPSTRYHEVGR